MKTSYGYGNRNEMYLITRPTPIAKPKLNNVPIRMYSAESKYGFQAQQQGNSRQIVQQDEG